MRTHEAKNGMPSVAAMLRVTCGLIMVACVSANLAHAQVALQITEPADGSVVVPGQVLQIVVDSPMHTDFSLIGVNSPLFDLSFAEPPLPARFSFVVAPDIALGTNSLAAFGRTAAGPDASARITVDVERPDMPTSLAASVSRLSFEAQGQDDWLHIRGTFADGRVLGVTQSSSITYASADDSIAKVDAFGHVTTISPGTTSLTARYTIGAQHRDLVIPVRVRRPVFSMDPTSLDFGTQDVGTSTSQQMTLTNTTAGTLGIDAITTGGDFTESDNCVSASPLAVGASCVVTVTFRPTQRGLRTSRVLVVNDFTVPVAFWLSGTGQ